MITDEEQREKDFKDWLKESGMLEGTVKSYSASLRKKIPNKLKEINEFKYSNLFQCLDISYLKTLHRRFLTGGDLYDFSQSVSNGVPSASTANDTAWS